MTSIYLSSNNPRWTPKTEADLEAAVTGGLLEENHHLDLKRAPNSKGDNKELARDLSSFAVDGGTLIIGVQENKESRTFELAPQPLNGLPEKIEQVARTIPDPPLTIVTEEISVAANDETGYLIVHIPASPVAPHMVDNRYFGRGDKTKYQMGDAQVVALHAKRRSAEADTLFLLQKQMEEDPLRDVGDQSHLFLVVQPTALLPGYVPADHRCPGLEPAHEHADQACPRISGPAIGTRRAGIQSRPGRRPPGAPAR